MLSYRIKKINDRYYPQYRKFFIWWNYHENGKVVSDEYELLVQSFINKKIVKNKNKNFKYRIIERNLMYYPQYKRFFNWYSIYKIKGSFYICHCYSLDDAYLFIESHKERHQEYNLYIDI